LKKWAHDKTARRVSQKAVSILERTMDHIHATGFESDFDLTRPSEAAILLLRQALVEVNAAERTAHQVRRDDLNRRNRNFYAQPVRRGSRR
jgi:hypothetical protein